MNVQQLFLQRYEALVEQWIGKVWTNVPDASLQKRPHARLNSVVWNLWHVARVEDCGLNRFVVDRPQIFDEGDWSARLNVPLRHHGTGMTLAEVDALNRSINIDALYDYWQLVVGRTRQIVADLDADTLDDIVTPERLQQILFDEGVAGPNAQWLPKAYAGWSKGKCLMHFGQTHTYQHVGEITTLLTLMDLDIYGL